MSNELAVVSNNFPTQAELQNIGLIARTAYQSTMYAGIGGEAKIMMILLAAKELGVGPCQALNGGIWSIQGKIEISARLMNGLIRRAGHSIKIVKSTDTECILLGTRTDGDSFECSFTQEDATRAGLWGSNVWKKYPGDMLYNRCMSRLARRLFSDVIGQCYIEGELSEAKAVEKMQPSQYEDVTPEPAPVTPPPEPVERISDEHATDLITKISELSKEDAEKIYGWAAQKYDARSISDLPESQYTPFLGIIERAKIKSEVK